MIPYDEIAFDVFDNGCVWADDIVEGYFYRWTWERIAPILDAGDVDAARVDAVTLAYVYDELCYLIRDENFHEVLWERMGEFAPEEEDDYLEYSEDDEDCEEDDDCDSEAEDEYADAEDRIRERVIANHGRVVEALRSVGAMNVLLAFHASCAKPRRIEMEEDGEEYEDELVWDYESFCRYVADADYRAGEINGMAIEEYAAAYEWLESGAEMLEPCA